MDPEQRRLVQIGYNQPLEGKGPIAGYGFFYDNKPGFVLTNLTLRLVVAPIYLDAELGFRSLLGPNTDAAVGLAGGGFAQSYSEIRDGHYFREESFIGHGGDVSASVYHRFNPDQELPVSLILRGGAGISFYEPDDKTDPAFELPDKRSSFYIRTGLRCGGQEPSLTEPLAMELSFWHESQFRSRSDRYGFNGDRAVEAATHLFWARALLKYTFENEHLFEFSFTGGTSLDADRFNAYRLGGVLPFASEFPLSIPGYYYQELSAERFALFNGQYSFPLTPRKNLRFTLYGAGARMDYLNGLEQPGHWHAGAGGGLSFISTSGTWMATLIYAHGFDAIRSDGRGANQIGLLFQWDLEAKRRGKSRFFTPGISPYRSRGGERLFRQ
ncbi:MAG: hypothetical protein HOP33_07690 [Verrucomicrobia bacterium]|nr:hypothetical protein [Verrucomicrobiota bacterium]